MSLLLCVPNRLHANSRNLHFCQGCAALADSFTRNTTCLRLDLRQNVIYSAAAEHLARLLERNKTLTQLDLNHNKMWAEGFAHLANALAKTGETDCLHASVSPNNRLQRQPLHCACSKLGIIAALKFRFLLRTMPFADMCLQGLTRALHNHRNLQVLSLKYNG